MELKDKKTQRIEMGMRGRGGWCKTAECSGVDGRQLLWEWTVVWKSENMCS